MTCYRPGERSRLFYAVQEYTGRKDQPKGFGWRDFRDMHGLSRTFADWTAGPWLSGSAGWSVVQVPGAGTRSGRRRLGAGSDTPVVVPASGSYVAVYAAGVSSARPNSRA